MAQSWRVEAERNKKHRPPLDAEALERLALHYVGKYATTRAKLRSYLNRKVRERGWDGSPEPDFEAIAERLSGLGYIDDEAFAVARASSLQRRGYGARRVEQALRAAEIEEEDAAGARQQAQDGEWEAAMRFARRRRVGPFAAEVSDREAKQRAFAAMMRAGHPLDIVRKLLNTPPGDIPDSDKG